MKIKGLGRVKPHLPKFTKHRKNKGQLIDETIEKYEKRVSDFESDMAPKEEVDILKMSPNRGSSFMSNYQNANMRDYDDTKKYSEKDL
mgnify:CR=1 FL=1